MGSGSSRPSPPPVYYCSTCGAGNSSTYCPHCYQKRIARENEDRQRAHQQQQAAAKAKQFEAERSHALRLKQMEQAAIESARNHEIAKKQQEAAEKAKQLEAERNHNLKLQQMKEAAIESARNHEKAMKQQAINSINESINKCDSDINKWENNIKLSENNINNIISKQSDLKSKLLTLNEKFEKRKEEIENDLILKRRTLKLDEYSNQLKLCNDKIESAINRTCVSESNIGKFLLLTQYLTQATLSNQAEIDRLSSIMDTFSKLIAREGNGDLTIEYYFDEKNMSKFIKLLENEELYNMEDIICDTDDDYKELNELILNQLTLENEKWKNMTDDEKKECNQLKEPKTILNFKEKNFFKRVCTKPDTWQKFANEKQGLLKERLTMSSPVYCIFFEEIFKAMEQAQAMLTYNDDLNDQQRKAIELCSSSNSSNNNNNNNSVHKPIAIGSASSVSSNDNDNENDDDNKENNNNNNDNNGDSENDEAETKERLMVLMNGMDNNSQRKIKDSLALRECAIKSIDVVSTLKDKIDDIGEFGSIVSGVITSVENTCMKIITAQSNIRQSVLLAQEICKLKPALLSDTAKELWSAVDKGIINIFKTALVLNKSSMDYFGYFFKFRQSFGHFLAGKDKSLLVSTENLKKDIKSFIKFSVTFEKKVESLSTEAMKCIESCVQSTIGAEEFEKVRIDRNIAQTNYLKSQKMYNEFIEKINMEYNTLFENKTKLESDINTNVLILDSLNQQKSYQIQMRQQIVNTKTKLLDAKSRI